MILPTLLKAHLHPFEESGTMKEDKLAKFESRMRDLQTMLHDAKQAEFTVVTIPTEVAADENHASP